MLLDAVLYAVDAVIAVPKVLSQMLELVRSGQ